MFKKISTIVIHPILFASYMVLAVIATDTTLIFSIQAGRVIWFVPLIALLAMMVVQRFTKDWHYTGFVVTMGIVLFGYYGHVYRLARSRLDAPWLVNHAVLLPLWGAMIIFVGGPWIWRRVQNGQFVTQFFNLVGIAAVLFPLNTAFRINQQLQNDPLNDWKMPPLSHPVSLQTANRPDIYYIIADGYARADVLSSLYGYDNSAFIQYLENHGFYVAEQSQSNYPRTALSLPSSLNLDYLQSFISEAESNTANWFPLHEMIVHSRARSLLSEAGYQFIAYSSGFFYTEIRDADRYLSPYKLDINEFEQLLLSTTAFDIPFSQGWLPIPSFSYTAHRQRILYPLAHLGEAPDPQRPQFVFTHILLPHPPFVFDQNGNFIEPGPAYEMTDGDVYEGTVEEYRQDYVNQLIYTNRRLEETIDRILENATQRGVIIVIQADHGPRSSAVGQPNDHGCFYERYSILNAYYLPAAKDQLYPTITPVNTFRLIFDHYFGTQFGLLPDINYNSGIHRPYQFDDATIESHTPCTP